MYGFQHFVNLREPESDVPGGGVGGVFQNVWTLMFSSLEQTSLKNTRGMKFSGIALCVLQQRIGEEIKLSVCFTSYCC